MRKYVILTLGLFMALTGCQRSDICPENTPTTPRLVIKFYDFQNPNSVKPVHQFNAREENSSNFYFDEPVTDTVVSVALRTDKNFTNYQFVINQDNDSLLERSATIKFSYAPKAVYVNRACGYKTEFLGFNANTTQQEGQNNWIKNIDIQQPNDIIDEQTTHLYIYH